MQYEGQEQSENIFYTGAAPNQQAIPAVEYLMSPEGGSAERFVLLGTDYVYPRTTNQILRAFLKSKGVAETDIMEEYTPFGLATIRPSLAILKASRRVRRRRLSLPLMGIQTYPFIVNLPIRVLKPLISQSWHSQ